MIPAALIAVLGLQWHAWPPPASQASLNEVASEPDTIPQTDMDALAQLEPALPKDSYASIIERPLFRPERRPPEEEDLDGQTALDDLNDPENLVSLSGMDLNAVIITPTLVTAWVRDPSRSALRKLRVGDDVEGWMVDQILPDRILLERQGERDTLILRDYGSAAPETVPAAAPETQMGQPRRLRIPPQRGAVTPPERLIR